MASQSALSDLVEVDDELSSMAIVSLSEANGDSVSLQPHLDGTLEGNDSPSDQSLFPARKPSLPRSRAKKARTAAHQTQQRKPPLRPAKDILSRIRHDPVLDESEWIVGYHDRLEGVVEMDVSSWNRGGDFTDEEWIPQHRILYFRKRTDESDRRMWDREARLDRLFGSGLQVDESRGDRVDAMLIAHKKADSYEYTTKTDDGNQDSMSEQTRHIFTNTTLS